MTDSVTRSAPPLRHALARVWHHVATETRRDPALVVTLDYWRALCWLVVVSLASPLVVLYARTTEGDDAE